MKSVLSSLNSARNFNPELEHILEAAIARLQGGDGVDIDMLAADHSEFATELRELWPVVEMMVLMGGEPPAQEAWTDGKNGQVTPPPEHKQLGDFRLLRQIGQGGMGTVYEAEQLSTGRRVALKMLPFAALAHDKSLQRFRNEVRAAAALDHPHIVSIYSVGEERGVHFYAMQLIRGQTLADMIQELRKTRQLSAGVPLTPPSVGNAEKHTGKASGTRSVDTPTIDSAIAAPPSTKRVEQARISTAGGSRQTAERFRSAARLGIQAAEALQHAHDLGVLHRDIKPSNLMIDREAQLYITDFGLARIEADAGMTMTGDIVGTLRYMAPEQALAKRVVIDHRADVYSLGATLYELLTLQPAFGETDRSELLKQIAFEEPRSLRKLDRRIPVDLESIVLKAMGKNPEERYQTSQRLADDLQAFLECRTTQAKPPTMMTRAIRWSRRHPAVTRSAAAILIVTTIGSTLATVSIWKAKQAAQQSADVSRAVVEFLTNDLLAAAQPLVDQRNDLTIRELLGKADKRIDGAFNGQPVVESAVRVAIGRSYVSLGDYDRAREQFVRARALAVGALGSKSMEALTAEYNFARVLNIASQFDGRYAEARAALEVALMKCREELGPDHLLTISVEYQLGINARKQEWDDEAIERQERVLKAARRKYGTENLFTQSVMGELSFAYLHRGDIASAEMLAQEVLSVARRLYGPDDLRLIAAEQNLAKIPSSSRSNEDICRVREKTLAAYRIAYGIKHIKTLGVMRELAEIYRVLGQYDKSSQLTAEVAAGYDHADGPQ